MKDRLDNRSADADTITSLLSVIDDLLRFETDIWWPNSWLDFFDVLEDRSQYVEFRINQPSSIKELT